MLVAITILMVMANIGIACVLLVLLAILGKIINKPKDFEDAKADFFKAWGDNMIKDYRRE